MRKSKFKVGDIVRCTRVRTYTITDCDVPCRVTRYPSLDNPSDMTVIVIGDRARREWDVQPSYFELVEQIIENPI